MGKYVFAVLTVFAIEYALFLFGGQGISNTSIFNLLYNPSAILSNPFYILIGVAIAAFAISPIIPGTFIQQNTFYIYATIIVATMTFAFSIAHFYIFMYGELENKLTAELAKVITTLITAPLLAFYFFASVEWIRSNQ